MISHVAQSLKLHCSIYFAFYILADTGAGSYSFCPFKYLGSYQRLAEGTLIRIHSFIELEKSLLSWCNTKKIKKNAVTQSAFTYKYNLFLSLSKSASFPKTKHRQSSG